MRVENISESWDKSWPTVKISVLHSPVSVPPAVAENIWLSERWENKDFLTSRICELHRFEVQPNIANIICTFLHSPLTGPGRGVGGGVARVPDVGDVPGDCSPAGAGGEETAASKPSSARTWGLSSLADTFSLKHCSTLLAGSSDVITTYSGETGPISAIASCTLRVREGGHLEEASSSQN